MSTNAVGNELADRADRHIRFGWWSLLCFVALGIVLEGLHGLKIGWYLNVSNETGRLMWTLSHAHGTLLALIHIAFAVTLRAISGQNKAGLIIASRCLTGAAILVPAGFFLGGAFTYGGDPGLGILLLPVGAVLLLVAIFLTARAAAPSPTTAARSQTKAANSKGRKRRGT